MAPACFYFDSDELVVGEVVLSGDEGRHAVSVRRMRVGEAVLLSNGRGWLGTGEVKAVCGRDRLIVQLRSWQPVPRRTPQLTVALALIKGARLDAAVEQLGEVGVDEVVLFAARRSVVRSAGAAADDAVSDALMTKLRRRAVEAMKQSRQGWMLGVERVAGSGGLCRMIAARGRNEQVFVLDQNAPELAVSPAVQSAPLAGAERITVVVGPEGGLTTAELGLLADAGATSVRLGGGVMRSGTAAVAGAVAFSLAAGRWQTADRD